MTADADQKFALVVDDDPILFEPAAAILSGKGFSKITHAPTAAAAIQHLQSSQPISLILLDLNMPGTDGVELFHHLQEHWSNVPTVIVSAADVSVRNAAFHLAKAYGLDVRGAIGKPLTGEKIDEVFG